MTYSKRLWLWLAGIFILSFAILGLIGREIYVKSPPVPAQVISASGETLFTKADIENGREVWQTLGGMQLGSVWGHGGYVAPDWGADFLHREATTLLDIWARADGAKDFAALDLEEQAALKSRLKQVLRANSYDAATDTITVSDVRAKAIAAVSQHYRTLFSSDPSLHALGVQYAIPEKSITDPEYRRQLSAFFFWSAWTSVTERPGEAISYTNNWPHEPLVGNTPTASLGIWSVASFLFLIAGIGWLLWYQARRGEEEHATVRRAIRSCR